MVSICGIHLQQELDAKPSCGLLSIAECRLFFHKPACCNQWKSNGSPALSAARSPLMKCSVFLPIGTDVTASVAFVFE